MYYFFYQDIFIQGGLIMKFYIGDLHFNHERVIDFDNRPFESVEEMNEALIDNWNNQIGKKDEVYIVGDFFMKNQNAVEILSRLKGNKFLVRGNHDRINNDMTKHFIKIEPYMRLKDEGHKLVLSHYPLASWESSHHGSYHFYAHVHNSIEYERYLFYKRYCLEQEGFFNSFNVGCMMDWMNYTPQTFNTIILKGE